MKVEFFIVDPRKGQTIFVIDGNDRLPVPVSVAEPGAFSRLQPRPLSKSASAHLDMVRAIAAWLVLWGHVRNLFFVDFGTIQDSSRLVKVLYFVTGYGHQSVVVFFVLSGFLIGSTVIKRFVSGNWSWRSYAIDRLTRLYVVLIPGLLFGLLWDKTGSTVFAPSGLYSQPLLGFGGIVENRITLGAFFSNLAFLQTLKSPVFGSNGPLWSLANEFWYYVLFPIAMAALVAWRSRIVGRATFFTLLAICVAVFVSSPILPGFLIWMAGCVLVVIYSMFSLTKRLWVVSYVLASAIFLVACLVATRIRSTGPLGSDFTLGIAFSAFLFGILQLRFEKSHEYYSRIAHFLAGFSYSLYVLHFPLLLFFRAWIVPTQRWQPFPLQLSYGLSVGMVSLVFAWSVSMFTEKKTGVLRGWADFIVSGVASYRLAHRSKRATIIPVA